MACVCCAQGCPDGGAVADESDEFCQQCQKDGCPWPTVSKVGPVPMGGGGGGGGFVTIITSTTNTSTVTAYGGSGGSGAPVPVQEKLIESVPCVHMWQKKDDPDVAQCILCKIVSAAKFVQISVHQNLHFIHCLACGKDTDCVIGVTVWTELHGIACKHCGAVEDRTVRVDPEKGKVVDQPKRNIVL